MGRLTLFMPTWNGAALLRSTLDSLAAQTCPDLEILVVDDASDDDTCRIAESHPCPRIQVHRNSERLGLAGNWNRALRLVHSEYAALVGQDDLWHPTWAERLTSLLDAHPEAPLAFCRRRIDLVDETSRSRVGEFFTRTYPKLMSPFLEAIGQVIPPELVLHHACLHHFEMNLIGEPSFVIFRADHPAVAEGFDEAMPQMVDWEFHTRFFRDAPILHCPDELGTYRLHGSAESINNSGRNYFPELHHLLGVVLKRFEGRLDAEQRERLESRREAVLREIDRWNEGHPSGDAP